MPLCPVFVGQDQVRYNHRILNMNNTELLQIVAVLAISAVYADDEKKTEKRGLSSLGYGGIGYGAHGAGYDGLGYGGLSYGGLGYGGCE